MLSLTPALRRGFTLIELLTVVAIIGILAAILIPVVSRVREKAKETRCVSNLRQVGVALQSYANDNKGNLPSVMNGSVSPYYNRNPAYIHNSLLPYIGTSASTTWSTSDGKASYSGIFDCIGYKGQSVSQFSYISYRLNLTYTNSDGTSLRTYGEMDASGTGKINKQPGKLINMPSIWAMRDNDYSTTETNHSGHRNAVFFDGHVGRLDMNNNPI